MHTLSPTDPTLPTPREATLHDRLGCASADVDRYQTGMAAYGCITRTWSLAWPGEPTPDLLALNASAHMHPWPSTAPAAGSTPTCLAPRRRPAAPRAPARLSRSVPIGRAAAEAQRPSRPPAPHKQQEGILMPSNTNCTTTTHAVASTTDRHKLEFNQFTAAHYACNGSGEISPRTIRRADRDRCAAGSQGRTQVALLAGCTGRMGHLTQHPAHWAAVGWCCMNPTTTTTPDLAHRGCVGCAAPAPHSCAERDGPVG